MARARARAAAVSRPLIVICPSSSLGWGISVTFLRYGAQFFKQRRILQQYLAKTEVTRFRIIHTEEARKMLKNLLDRPADFDWLVRRYVSATFNLPVPCT